MNSAPLRANKTVNSALTSVIRAAQVKWEKRRREKKERKEREKRRRHIYTIFCFNKCYSGCPGKMGRSEEKRRREKKERKEGEKRRREKKERKERGTFRQYSALTSVIRAAQIKWEKRRREKKERKEREKRKKHTYTIFSFNKCYSGCSGKMGREF